MTVARLIGVVYHDEHRRMEMFTDKPERGQHVAVESFSFIRATGGHAPHVNINHRALFSDRQEFAATSHAKEYGGPDTVYYYTDLAGLIHIWQFVRPTHDTACLAVDKFIVCL